MVILLVPSLNFRCAYRNIRYMEMNANPMTIRKYTKLVQENVLISDIVSHYTPIYGFGHHRFTCLCPFHNDKSPSLDISNKKGGVYYCFSCGASGSTINFVKNIDNLSYIDAVQKIIQITGISIPPEYENLPKYINVTRDEILLMEEKLLKSNSSTVKSLSRTSSADRNAILLGSTINRTHEDEHSAVPVKRTHEAVQAAVDFYTACLLTDQKVWVLPITSDF